MNDTINTVAHGSIAGGTIVSLATPDHTTQFIALAVQLISLLIVVFKPRNQNKH
jgi:hypothetical protein